MESWRKVWRTGFAPLIRTEGLEALRKALFEDDPRIVQDEIAIPPADNQDLPIQRADAITFCGWQGSGHDTVGAAEEYFALLTFQVDQSIGEPAGCRWFLNWYEDTPREQMRVELLAEVELELTKRLGEANAGAEACPFCGGVAEMMIDDIWKCEPCDRTWSPRVMEIDDDGLTEDEAFTQEIGGEG